MYIGRTITLNSSIIFADKFSLSGSYDIGQNLLAVVGTVALKGLSRLLMVNQSGRFTVGRLGSSGWK